jgi:hypothetical protein
MRYLLGFMLLASLAQAQVLAPFYVVSSGGGGGSVTVRDTVTADNEDGTDNSTGPAEYLSVGGYDQIYGPGPTREMGLIFQLAVPQGKTIDSVFIWVYVRDYGVLNSMRVKCYDVDNAPIFNATHTHMLNAHATLGTDSVTWSPFGTSDSPIWQGSPNLKTIVQTVINRAGWVSGNNIGFVFYTLATETEEVRDYGGDATKSATIRVVYH